jgi:hypothetical protein
MTSSEGELKARSICDFFNSPLISDQIAGRRNYCWLPPISMIFRRWFLDLDQRDLAVRHYAVCLGVTHLRDRRC